jgi:hypothetical protein
MESEGLFQAGNEHLLVLNSRSIIPGLSSMLRNSLKF